MSLAFLTYVESPMARQYQRCLAAAVCRAHIDSLLHALQSARKRPSVEELMGHPWIAVPWKSHAGPAASDGASQQAVQLPPPQLGALATQVLKRYAFIKEVISHCNLLNLATIIGFIVGLDPGILHAQALCHAAKCCMPIKMYHHS